MAYESGTKIDAASFISLKNRVKAEMTRRNGYGAIPTADINAVESSPTQNANILGTETQKINIGLNKINSSFGDPALKAAGNKITELNTWNLKLTLLESQSKNATSNNDCSGYCTGMCVSTCTGGCTSCSGGCSGGCSGCSGGCSGCSGCGSGCATSCSGCSGTCSGSCSGCSGCGSGCASSCVGYCTGCGYCSSSGCSGTCWIGCMDGGF